MQKTDTDNIYFSVDTPLYPGCWLKINLKKGPSRIVPSVGWSQFLIIVDRGDWKYRLYTKPGYLYDLYREYGHYPQAIYRHCSNTMLQLYNPKPQRPQNFEEMWIGRRDFDSVYAIHSRSCCETNLQKYTCMQRLLHYKYCQNNNCIFEFSHYAFPVYFHL